MTFVSMILDFLGFYFFFLLLESALPPNAKG